MATYKLIASSTVGSSGANTVEFTSIPGTYTDLLVKISARSIDTSVAAGYDPLLYRINSATSGYLGRQLFGDGSTVGSGSEATRTSDIATGTWGRLTYYGINNGNTTASVFSVADVYFSNYASSTAKSVNCDFSSEGNGLTYYSEFITHLNSTTSAITSIAFALGKQYFGQYSTFYLYGISNA